MSESTSNNCLHQDWACAERSSLEATRIRSDIAWPFVIQGWIAEMKAEPEKAADWYCSSMKAFGTTVAFTDSWSYCEGEVGRSFSSIRYRRMKKRSDEEDARVRAAISEPDPLGTLRTYWVETGDQLLKSSKSLEAYECFYRAGWDAYCTDDMDVILERLIRAADEAGSKALSSLGRLHLEAWQAIN
jgi:hypothetical protein